MGNSSIHLRTVCTSGTVVLSRLEKSLRIRIRSNGSDILLSSSNRHYKSRISIISILIQYHQDAHLRNPFPKKTQFIIQTRLCNLLPQEHLNYYGVSIHISETVSWIILITSSDNFFENLIFNILSQSIVSLNNLSFDMILGGGRFDSKAMDSLRA